jgi:putative GTP pyrophosphokinase
VALSRTQVDKLGERLKSGPVSETDLRLLDDYRRGFVDAYLDVLSALVGLGLRPRSREAKSRSAIVDKLRRESIRLTQIQDIAGCRLWVFDLNDQDREARRIEHVLSGCRRFDRRTVPSHGYRALHLVAERHGRPVEIQIRTELQHLWARTSEMLSDRLGAGLKYGQGPPEMLAHLESWSTAIRQWEEWVAAPRESRSSTLDEQTAIEQIHQFALRGGDTSVALLRRLRGRQADAEAEP